MNVALLSQAAGKMLLQAHDAAEGGEHASDLIQAFDWADAELVAATLIVGLPLLASLVTFFVGKTMWRGGAAITIAALVGSLLASLYLFWNHIVGGAEVVDFSRNWFTIGHYDFTVGFLLDNLSVWLAALVSLLSLLIVVFSTHYLHEEPDAKLRRYYAVKALFVAGMLGTVL